MHHGNEAEHDAGEESPKAADEERTDREDGGPTSGDREGGDVSGGAKGTRESPFEPHE